MKNLSGCMIIAICLCVLSGCASIISGSKQELLVYSEPEGAMVEIDGLPRARTPLITYLSRDEHIVHIELLGYAPINVITEKSLNPWCFGNLIFGGIVGGIIDIATGAVNQFSPDEIYANLVPLPERAIEDAQDRGAIEDRYIEKLKKLKELRDLELITEEEYEVKRKLLADQLWTEKNQPKPETTPPIPYEKTPPAPCKTPPNPWNDYTRSKPKRHLIKSDSDRNEEF